MTSINISARINYNSTLPVTPKATDDSKKDDDPTTAKVDVKGSSDAGGAQAANPNATRDQLIKQMQQQIAQTQKLLQQEQQQLAAAQKIKGSAQEKSQQVMAIQQQISGTMAQLGAQEASLMQLMKGSVNTTA